MDAHQHLVVRRTRLREFNIIETRWRGEEEGFHEGG